MGYLSQKKQQTRKNIFLYFMVLLLTVLTAISLSGSLVGGVYFNLFHLFCISGLIIFYCLFAKKYKMAFFFGLLFLLNYTSLSAVANIFVSDSFNGNETVELEFNQQKKLVDTLPKDKIVSAGTIILAQNYNVPYAVLEYDNQITLVRIDLRKAKKKEYQLIFEHLYEFILKQDNPVIVFGEFGLPAWDPNFKKFISNSGLSIKNKLLFTQGNVLGFLDNPCFYVLGFRDMGISEIAISSDKKQNVINIMASFTTEHS